MKVYPDEPIVVHHFSYKDEKRDFSLEYTVEDRRPDAEIDELDFNKYKNYLRIIIGGKEISFLYRTKHLLEHQPYFEEIQKG